MKKLCILLSILLVFTAGCGKKKPEAPAPSPAVVSPSPAASAEPSTGAENLAPANDTERPAASAPQNSQPEAYDNNQQENGNRQPASGQSQPDRQAQPPAQQPQQPAEQPKVQTVTLTISVPSEGRKILNQFPVEFEDGDTTFSVLKKATRQQGIQMSFSGGNSNPYVEGIDNLYEFDKGAGSGWMCSKNGVFISKSSGKASLSAGDSVLWVYTLDLGKDIGAHVE